MTNDDEVQQTAQATSRKVQPSDPYVEPPNSTVDDWFGQRVQRDADRVDKPTDSEEHATGERQARENIANDPPA